MTKLEFSGNLEEVKSEIEQAVATYELLGNRSSVDFEQWFEKWETGFLTATENRALGNYQLTGENAWRSSPEKRPRFRQWSNEGGIITGEYWRDRSVELESIVLSGSSDQLIQHVVQLEYEGGGENQGSKNKSKIWPPMKGQPTIKLHFKGENRAKAETSIVITTKTDDPKIPLPKITQSDLRSYAKKIKEQFATPNLFVWKKGREILSYKNRWQGFDGQYWLCRNETAGMEVLTRLLKVVDLPLDTSKIRMSTATDEATAFPANPPDITVLNQTVPQDTERPLVDVIFWRAEIILAKLPTPILLVERGVITYD